MHNSYYASGFLYHPATEQILLHQDSQSPTEWKLFTGKNQPNERPEQTMHRIISDTLGITLKKDVCFPVYDYLHKEHRIPHYIFYVEAERAYDEEELLTEQKTAWFLFRQIGKLAIQKQTKQDIIVGQRVINLAIRELLPPTT